MDIKELTREECVPGRLKSKYKGPRVTIVDYLQYFYSSSSISSKFNVPHKWYQFNLCY